MGALEKKHERTSTVVVVHEVWVLASIGYIDTALAQVLVYLLVGVDGILAPRDRESLLQRQRQRNEPDVGDIQSGKSSLMSSLKESRLTTQVSDRWTMVTEWAPLRMRS